MSVVLCGDVNTYCLMHDKQVHWTSGGQQLKEIDFFKTCAPVVQWTTVPFMIILEILLGLKFKQGDVTAECIHVELPSGSSVTLIGREKTLINWVRMIDGRMRAPILATSSPLLALLQLNNEQHVWAQRV